jgi:hypothetical protein
MRRINIIIISILFSIGLTWLIYDMSQKKQYEKELQSKLNDSEIKYANSGTDVDSLLLNEVIKIAERAYFEGQKDAIEGDVRISKKDSIYVWTKSCWDGGNWPLYKPTVEDSKK